MRGAAAVPRAPTPMTGHPTHPLDPLSADEITAVVAAVRDGHDGDLRFVIFRGRTRYVGRTLCDHCTEEVLEAMVEPGEEPSAIVLASVQGRNR